MATWPGVTSRDRAATVLSDHMQGIAGRRRQPRGTGGQAARPRERERLQQTQGHLAPLYLNCASRGSPGSRRDHRVGLVPGRSVFSELVA
jgi:hypothetical protein